MKKQFKILLVAISIAMLSLICCVMAFAASTIAQDAVFQSVSVSTGGNVKMHFVYSDLGSAKEMVAEIYAPGATEPENTVTYDAATLTDKTVTVPLSPAQLDYTVKVYAKDGDAKGAVKSYSVVDYANTILGHSGYTQHHNAMRALLNWGAMAQMYFSDSSTLCDGYYTRGTNPVNDTVEFFTGEGAVTDGALIDIAAWQVFLAPGDTTMKIYFDYSGEETLKAYVQKENGEPVPTQIVTDAETGMYCVNIHNLGAAVYNTEYTVSITDGSDSASATKTVLEYLNTLAFGQNFVQEQQNLAKAMYQFYTHTAQTVGECEHTVGHYTANAAEGEEQIICSTCLTVLGTFPSSLDYYSNISHTTVRDMASNSSSGAVYTVENGVGFVRATPTSGSITETTMSVGKSVTVGKYVFIKYRVKDKATGDLTLVMQSGDDREGAYESTVPLVSVQTRDWIIAALDISDTSFKQSNVEPADLKILFRHSDTLDIAWVVMDDAEDDSTIRQAFLGDTEYYYFRGNSFNFIDHGQKRNKSGVQMPDIEMVKTVGASQTTYKYVCTFCGGDRCGVVDGHEKTFSNNVFNADITKITTSGTNQIRSESGMVYNRIATGGETATTTITANDIPIGWAMFMKYRFNGGKAPTGTFRVQIEYVVNGGTKKIVLNHTATNEELAKRHVGWVIDRVNCKGGVTTNTQVAGPTLQPGDIAESIIITIVHSDDIDIAYFFSDPDRNEKNVNTFPQMVRDGDIYYINSANAEGKTYFGAYVINQWREITNASNGTTGRPGASETANNLWPNPYNTTASCQYGHTIVFDAGYAATCKSTGLTNGTHCSVCGETIISREVLPTISHVAGNLVIENSHVASCEQGGSYDEVHYCIMCDEEMSRDTIEFSSTGHTPVIDKAVAPTCEEKGLTQGSHCSICAKVIEAQEDIPALGHTSGDTVVENSVAPGCEIDGSYDNVVYCVTCGKELSRNTVDVDAVGHTTVNDAAVSATCYRVGLTEGSHCSACGEVFVEQTELPMLDHVTTTVHTSTEHCTKCESCGTVFYSNNTSSYTMQKTVKTSTTVYSYVCTQCNIVVNQKEFSNGVYYADITSISASGSVEGVTTVVEDGLIYTHIATSGDRATTTFTASNVPLGIPIFIKYRLNNGLTPMGNLTVKIVYKYGGKEIVLSNTEVENANLVKRHQGWVVGRINATSVLNGAGVTISNKTVNAIADSVTVTIVHTDDLDIAYYMTDSAENNSNVFGQMMSDGDVYYMHQNLVVGSYIDNQWRKITSSTLYTSISDANIGNHLANPDNSYVADNSTGADVTEDFSRVESTTASPYNPKIAYGVSTSSHEYASILNEASALNMFDKDLPLRLDYVHEFVRDETVQVAIVDYYGEIIYREYLTGTSGQRLKLSAGIVDHPTGYYTITVDGVAVDMYVVTPSLKDRTVTDSPFALDAASTQRINNIARIGQFASAFRLVGVSWVRERMAWNAYQTADYGNGTYGYNDNYLNTIKSQLTTIKARGLNVLMTFSTAPAWATIRAQNTSGGGEITTGNYLGTYGTQLAIYDATNRIATALGNCVDVIELMNEPDHHAFRDLAENYTAWFKSAALGVVDAGTNMKISVGGMCVPTTWWDFSSIILNSDGMKYASVFNYHSHTKLPTGTSASIPDFSSTEAPTIKTISSTLDIFGVTKPVWISESGMCINGFSSESEKRMQTPYIVTSATQALSYGTDKYFWFLGTPYSEGDGDNYSSFTTTGKPYPTMAAYSVMTDVLGEAKYAGDLKNLPGNVRGYLFKTGNGDEMVAVLWRTSGSTTYTFNSSEAVVRTNMMGQEDTLNPTNGMISVTVSTNPIYLTFASAPADYYAYEYNHDELKVPELSLGDHIVLTPEIEGAKFTLDTKKYGHVIKSGTVINVRVSNHSDVEVSGTVSLTISGFSVSGNGSRVTVAPHSDAYVKMTLSGSGSIDDHITFTGTFTDGNTVFDCSPAVLSVCTGSQSDGEIEVTFGNLKLNQSQSASALSNAKVTLLGYNSKYSVRIMVDGGASYITDYSISSSFLSKTLTMNLSSLTPGKHVISIGFVSPGGDVQSYNLYVRYDGTNVIFSTEW